MSYHISDTEALARMILRGQWLAKRRMDVGEKMAWWRSPQKERDEAMKQARAQLKAQRGSK